MRCFPLFVFSLYSRETRGCGWEAAGQPVALTQSREGMAPLRVERDRRICIKRQTDPVHAPKAHLSAAPSASRDRQSLAPPAGHRVAAAVPGRRLRRSCQAGGAPGLSVSGRQAAHRPRPRPQPQRVGVGAVGGRAGRRRGLPVAGAAQPRAPPAAWGVRGLAARAQP
jgi:hypothetical protein